MIGSEQTELMSRLMRGWYGGPIALGGVPGLVYCTGDGDFVGPCDGETSLLHRAVDMARRLRARARITADPARRLTLHSGFSSLLALQRQLQNRRSEYIFDYITQGAGMIGGAGGVCSYWGAGNGTPVNGTNASAAPGGRVPVGGSDGGIKFTNANAGETSHFLSGLWQMNSAVALGNGGALLLYDRLFDVSYPSGTGTVAVTGVPTRYQNQTDNAADSIAGNFLFIEPQASGLEAAGNWTVNKYTNSAGSAATAPSQTKPANTAFMHHPFTLANFQWYMQLAAGDYGVKNLTQMQCDTAIGQAVSFVIGHPIAWFPCLGGNMMQRVGGYASAFNLCRIFDNACLSHLGVWASGNQRSPSGQFTVIAG